MYQLGKCVELGQTIGHYVEQFKIKLKQFSQWVTALGFPVLVKVLLCVWSFPMFFPSS